MRDILVLLVLLNVQTKVCSQPYEADSDGNCLNPATEYSLDDNNLCCKKCQPGQRVKQKCSKTTETVCESCPEGQYMENWNYSPNCFSCSKCKTVKGLQDLKTCSSTTRSRCGCKPGTYCIMEFDNPYCSECRKSSTCKAGYGVSVPGMADSDVKCERCPNGTFSDTVSSTDRCRPHTNCHGRAIVRKGDATSDTVCESEAFTSNPRLQTSMKEPTNKSGFAAERGMMTTLLVTPKVQDTTNSTLSISPSVSEAAFNHSTKSPPMSRLFYEKLAIASVIGIILLFIVIILLCLWKKIWRKEMSRFTPKVDANGNCETADKLNQGYLEETKQTSFTVTSPEHQCLLEGNGEVCTGQSQCSSNTENIKSGDDCRSSIGPSQSTMALHNPLSALSEPMTLLSNTEPVTPQTSVSTQSSSQPTSPHIISPVTTSPHVNVNITFHIGNGSGGTPSVMPTDLTQVNSHLPFGEEEEFLSIPQQEDGKQSLMSVQEGASYSV